MPGVSRVKGVIEAGVKGIGPLGGVPGFQFSGPWPINSIGVLYVTVQFPSSTVRLRTSNFTAIVFGASLALQQVLWCIIESL